ncbi:MAG: hypothetical protein EHM20_16045 [Alphaproteobacteria bacterium]|nr:MAG: hypothetical protein EHM20_16045 [Alphaproteobacteria bacterium]
MKLFLTNFIRLLVFFYGLIFSHALLAYEHQFSVTDIVGDQSIQIQRLDKQIPIALGDILVIYSHQTKQVLGYSRVISLTDNPNLFIANVETHNKNGIIRPENYLKKLDLTQIENDIPARYDLTYRDEHSVSAKYRPLVYAGLVQGMTASNLAKKEIILGPSIFAYGVTSRTQLNVNLASSIFGVANVGIKNKLIDTQDFELSIENGFQYYPSTSKGSYQFTGYLDMTSNSNFKSFAKFKVFTQKPEDQSLNNSEEYQRDLNLELQLAYGYIFSNWNQLIFGPKVDVDKKKVGGVVGYYVIEKNFNTMFGLSSSDFSEFRLGKQAYLVNLDFWWRF